MISAEEARKMTGKENKSRLRNLKRISEGIEYRIKNAAKDGNLYVNLSVLEEYEKEVISLLKDAGYKVKIENYHSEWTGNYFEIMISW